MTLEKICNEIEYGNERYRQKAEEKWQKVAIPLGSMGLMEKAVTKMCAAERTLKPQTEKKCVVVFCADNGVVEEGISQSGYDVTSIVAKNMCTGATSVCKMAEIAGADVIPVDIGMVNDVENDKLLKMKVARGTENFAKGAAMTYEEAFEALKKGMKVAEDLALKGYTVFATGEMGIGNTTTSSAVASVLLDERVEKMTGKGAGLSKEGVLKKIDVIEKAIKELKPDKNNVMDVLLKLGGFDILAMTGFMLGCAKAKKICIVDGFISSVSALCTIRLCPKAKDYILASHISAEPAGKLILEKTGLEPVINAQMRIGEGTGAVAFMPILEMSVKIFNEMVTFEETNIEPYKPL